MYIRLYGFVEKKLQFGFQKNHSTTDALIHLEDKMKNTIDKRNYACGIFVDF